MQTDKPEDDAVEKLAAYLCSEFDFDLNPVVGASWPDHENDDGYRGGGVWLRLQPVDVVARARENATRILAFLDRPKPETLSLAIRPLFSHGDKLVLIVATIIDTLRREIIYGDRERAIEKFQQLERAFARDFLNLPTIASQTPDVLDAAKAVVGSLAQTPEREAAMEALRAAVERAQ